MYMQLIHVFCSGMWEAGKGATCTYYMYIQKQPTIDSLQEFAVYLFAPILKEEKKTYLQYIQVSGVLMIYVAVT